MLTGLSFLQRLPMILGSLQFIGTVVSMVTKAIAGFLVPCFSWLPKLQIFVRSALLPWNPKLPMFLGRYGKAEAPKLF